MQIQLCEELVELQVSRQVYVGDPVTLDSGHPAGEWFKTLENVADTEM